MSSSRYQRITVAVLLVAVVAAGATWRSADQAYRAGARVNGHWIAVAGSALPALALASCALWLGRERRRGEAGATIKWLHPLLALSVVFVAFIVLVLWRAA